ncbi:MAG: hypothetical protein NTNFB02_27900 [Nitrospira sp.]
MRTALSVCIGLVLGITGTWYLTSGKDLRSESVPQAWAETTDKGTQDKPWTAAELEEIAKFYESTADSVEDEALKYERTAASITPLTDTKGFRRASLTIAAQSKWKQSTELRQLAAEHREKAQRMYARERAN